ncbi:MAG TPA: phosphatase PAP2 family protein [Polyangia bacterium]|nr:phosphatase PAP2 family protein [Polyangia bacterium]
MHASSRRAAAHLSRLLVATALFLTASLLAPRPVCADEAPPRKSRVEWSALWPRFHVWEYAATGVLDVANYYLYYDTVPPPQPKWRGDNVFDDTVRGWLRAETPGGRQRAARASDLLALTRYIVPFGIDLPVTLLIHRQVGVTWQLLMMDLEAFAVGGLITNLLFWKAGRDRPDGPDCAADAGYDPECTRGGNASFPSGHAQGVATAAGLTCVHHRYLPLYGSGAADGGACVLMSLAAVATGVTRIISDRHFTSDVLVGSTVGFAAGYGLPWLLHYRSPAEGESGATGRAAVVLPFAGPKTVGLSVVGGL